MNVSRTDAQTSALGGLSSARARMDDDASAIAADPSDIDAIVDLSMAEYAFKVNAVVLRESNRSLQSLVDMLA
jgi:hypothetical protein